MTMMVRLQLPVFGCHAAALDGWKMESLWWFLPRPNSDALITNHSDIHLGWAWKGELPDDSKWPFNPLVGGHLIF